MEYIRIRGARTHNLKNVNLDLPRHRLIVVTGLSGSGKSSLAFDTLYAEGQRRYVESLSAYARQFLQLMEKPDVDLIEGLSPAISIEQKATSHNPRSTVGTVTEIHDYLRLLYARVGDPYCPDHPEQKLAAMTISQMVDATLALPEDTKLMILAPVVVNRKGEQLDLFVELRAKGFVRVRVDGTVHEIDAVPRLAKNTQAHDRGRRRSPARAAGHEAAARRILRDRAAQRRRPCDRGRNGQGKCGGHRRHGASCSPRNSRARSATTRSRSSRPRLFSFNNPMGACPRCDGLGSISFFDPKRVVAFPQLSLASGAIKGWDRRSQFYFQMLGSLAKHVGFDLERPFVRLPERVQQILLTGSGDEKIPFAYLNDRGKATVREHTFEGIIPNLERRYRETDSQMVREELAKYLNSKPCPECAGTRLRRGGAVRQGRHGRQRARDLRGVGRCRCGRPPPTSKGWSSMATRHAIADRIVKEIVSRLAFLNNVGLDYLALDRSAETLSGGESQRIRLASQIGSGLTGVMYVLDEPSIGLHQRDNDRLLATLKHLRDLGNSVIVVEHDHDAICAADYIVDMGPGAGEHGGQVVAQGTPEEIRLATHSLTGQYLAGRRQIPMPSRRHRVDPARMLTIEGARGNNLKRITLKLPVGVFVCVTGVSGSGKSTLINDTLYHAVARHLYGSTTEPAPYDDMRGIEFFDKVISVDQSPIGRTPRSNPATYTGLFTPIRELFAQVRTARERGYGPGRFSFNVKGGRCEACQGDGLIKVEMHFLPDIYVPCDVCHGQRYNRETLDIRYKDKNIHEVLAMTVEQAFAFFEPVPAVARKLRRCSTSGWATSRSASRRRRCRAARRSA